jgi:PLP dependent protein
VTDTPKLAVPDTRLVTQIAERLAIVEAAIDRAGRRREEVTIVAVTKGFGAEEVVAARAAGLSVFGENYADELVEKAERVAPIATVQWTFQGRLQSNKINRLAPHVSLWQTVSSSEQASALAKRVPGAAALVQVNLTGRSEQGGAAWSEVDRIVGQATDAGLDVRGLMGIGPDTDDAHQRRAVFERLAAAGQRLGLVTVSMGMSGDYVDALSAGSTMIRLGGVLFGERPQSPLGHA